MFADALSSDQYPIKGDMQALLHLKGNALPLCRHVQCCGGAYAVVSPPGWLHRPPRHLPRPTYSPCGAQDLLSTLKARNAELEASDKLLNEARMKQEETARELEAARLEAASATEQLEGAWKLAEDETRRAQQLETEVGRLAACMKAAHRVVLDAVTRLSSGMKYRCACAARRG